MFFKCKWDLYERTQWHREGCEHSVKSKIMTRIQYDIHWDKNLTAISGDTKLSDVSPNSLKSREIQAEWVTGCHPAVKWMWTAAQICLRSLTFDSRLQDLEHILRCETLEENSWGLKLTPFHLRKILKRFFFPLMGYAQKENLQHPWSNMATKAQLVVQLCLTFIWMSLEQESNCILISLELENAILLKQMPNVNEILIWVSFAERLLVEI